jgi:peptidoglycan/LPS O-acetylase OafA/YrhL
VTLASAFQPRANSIGFLRFLFASLVLFGHSFILGGFPMQDPVGFLSGGTTALQALAVDGFFVLSGFLITGSFLMAPSAVDYLWRRVLRIFPGYWMCLLVTAFVFAPAAYRYEHGTLGGANWLQASDGPVSYVRNNAFLVVSQWNIWGLLSSTPEAHQAGVVLSIDGSLWTLRYEFECYMLVAAAGVLGILRQARPLVLVAALALWLVLIASTLAPTVIDNLPHGIWVRWLTSNPQRIRLWLMFAFGALLFLYRNHVAVGRWALVPIAVFAAATALGQYDLVGRFAFAYVCMWLASFLPIRNFDARGDVSYGIYIYAFPIQQLLALAGVAALGWLPYFGLAALITFVFAAASWYAIEAPAQRLKRVRVGRLATPHAVGEGGVWVWRRMQALALATINATD